MSHSLRDRIADLAGHAGIPLRRASVTPAVRDVRAREGVVDRIRGNINEATSDFTGSER